MQKKYLPSLVITLLSMGIYFWSLTILKKGFDFGLIAILAIVALLYMYFFRNDEQPISLLQKKTSGYLVVYGLLYFASIFFMNLLGSSIVYWLVQFLIPLLILKLHKESLSSIFFKWSNIFKDGKAILVSVILLVPFLIFEVRDSEQILKLFQSWKIILYMPISILYMLVIAAFWEEFFFRGILQSSILKLTKSASASIFLTALFFSTYHIPMRYYNVRSEYHGDLLSSMAGTINEQFIMGLFLGFVVYKSKNVWHGIWLHSILNGVSFVYQLSLMLVL
ncbi:CPBP family intramembrane glutamic endopeptidase [Flagellimonas pelagia]|uniref:CPBP family intramembrane metalloprotease n=1 Tax=Flagellimonas pelagia TaxID=2306998 RepID=A0A3A1NLS7_9FLAO|nr:CPBP family intramembrane glutamic endopeptidase [Allomuricauda maritima]RIV45375.1 CPBP family intramembrane metalloprotease [Allomuricauda maritima]TXJ96851.1 CPBP family intramembrane metalloprotease [Allomuricauda maritima]